MTPKQVEALIDYIDEVIIIRLEIEAIHKQPHYGPRIAFLHEKLKERREQLRLVLRSADIVQLKTIKRDQT